MECEHLLPCGPYTLYISPETQELVRSWSFPGSDVQDLGQREQALRTHLLAFPHHVPAWKLAGRSFTQLLAWHDTIHVVANKLLDAVMAWIQAKNIQVQQGAAPEANPIAAAIQVKEHLVQHHAKWFERHGHDMDALDFLPSQVLKLLHQLIVDEERRLQDEIRRRDARRRRGEVETVIQIGLLALCAGLLAFGIARR
jgi:hypothetical protein